MNIKHLLLFAGLAAGLTSCDHLLEFEPGDVILAEDAIQDAEDLQRLLVSNYDVVANLYGGRVQIANELRGPNFGEPDNSLDFTAVYNRETTFFTGINGGIYTDFYYAIYRSNVVIKNFDIVENLDPAERTRLEAEARFIRAICHWGAVKMYARPYGYTADNSHQACLAHCTQPRSPAACERRSCVCPGGGRPEFCCRQPAGGKWGLRDAGCGPCLPRPGPFPHGQLPRSRELRERCHQLRTLHIG